MDCPAAHAGLGGSPRCSPSCWRSSAAGRRRGQRRSRAARPAAVAPAASRGSSRAPPRSHSSFTLDQPILRAKRRCSAKRAPQVDDVVSQGANALDPQSLRRRQPQSSRSASRCRGTARRSSTRAEPRGGALLIHGLTDSPVQHARDRRAAERRRLLHAVVADAGPRHRAGRAGQRHVGRLERGGAHGRAPRARTDRPDRPLVLVGYSNGGALVTKYALDALDDASLPPPAKLILLSPMIGVSPAARLAEHHQPARSRWSPKARWIDVVPEYNPFKYNSFPANAGAQTARLTRRAQHRAAADGRRAGRLRTCRRCWPFSRVVDTTVSSPAVVHDLFEHLPPGTSELVLFDLNRQAGIDAFTTPERDPAAIDRRAAALVRASRS